MVAAKPAILCVHPNGELYGSDRTFIQAVQAYRERWPDARITVLLPVEGVLADVLRTMERDVQIYPLHVLRRAKLAGTIANMARLPLDIWRARDWINRYDLTYINTLVVLDFLLATRLARRPSMIHVHELPTGRTRTLFRAFLGWSRGTLVCISSAVRDTFPELRGRTMPVIWNGTKDRAVAPFDVADGKLHLLLIGRFNAWKGQSALIDALVRMPPEERARLAVRIVGSAYEGQEHFEADIHRRIAEHGLAETVTVLGFDPVPDVHYAWSHIVLVPSTKPEPFGLVAIEAMATGRAVIAAGHGGLAEIVADGLTGTLVQPGDADSLASAIRAYLADPSRVQEHGAAGRKRFEQCFREDIHKQHLADAATASIG